MMRIYMTGGTGFLGSNIIKVATERHQAEVFSTVHAWQASGPVNFQYAPVDLANREEVLKSVRQYKPDVIIHSGILNNFSLMYQDRKLAWRSYVDSTRNLTTAANDVGAKIIMISTDWVFDGTQSHADESTPPNPINYYGVLKVVGETIIHETANNGAVARVAGVNGMHWLRPDEVRPQNLGFGHFVTAVVDALGQGHPFDVWQGEINMHATLSLASESAELILRIFQQNQQGTFHCCSGQSMTRMELAHATAEVFELDASLIRSSEPDWGGLTGVLLPRDTSLSAVETANRLHYQLPTVRQLLQTYRHQLQTNGL